MCLLAACLCCGLCAFGEACDAGSRSLGCPHLSVGSSKVRPGEMGSRMSWQRWLGLCVRTLPVQQAQRGVAKQHALWSHTAAGSPPQVCLRAQQPPLRGLTCPAGTLTTQPLHHAPCAHHQLAGRNSKAAIGGEQHVRIRVDGKGCRQLLRHLPVITGELPAAETYNQLWHPRGHNAATTGMAMSRQLAPRAQQCAG